MSGVAVLLPASGDLRAKALGPADAFQHSPAMLPFGSRLALDLVRERYAAAGPAPALYLAIDRAALGDLPARALAAFTALDVGPTRDVCDTIARATARIPEDFLVINPVTTIPADRPTASASICLGREAIFPERWSSVSFPADGAPVFHFRDAERGQRRAFPFTGILSCRKADLLAALSELAPDEGGDLLHLARRLHARGASAFVHTDWIDLGHRATYAQAQRLCLSSRAFNRVTYSEERDLIVKRSTDTRTLEREGRYLAALPRALQRYFPALLASEHDPEGGWRLTQEYVPFPTLAETFLHWDVGPNAWERILARLDAILREFERCSAPATGDCGWLYGDKCTERMELLRERRTQGAPPFDQDLVINGRTYPSLSRSVELAVERLAPLERGVRLGWIHGDLCLGNILCDPLFGVIKLIDPRGRDDRDGPPGLGDPRYDLAKLNHSFHGLYDPVVNNLFRVARSSAAVDLEVYRPPNHDFVLGTFRERILDPHLDRESAELFTASLFLSMLPLHAEDTERLTALMAIGVVLLHDGSMDRILRGA